MTQKAKIPEIRFAGFTADWDIMTIGDCFFERIESLPGGELISVTINTGVRKFSELGRHDNSNEDKTKYKKVVIGDIAYNTMRMWQGASGYSPYNGIVSPAYTVITPFSDFDSKFFAYMFKCEEMIHSFQLNSQGITSDNWNLKFSTLSKISVVLPKNIKEQNKISSFLSSIDCRIALQQRKVEKLQNVKKSMLEKMFPKAGSRVPEIRFAGFTGDWEQKELGKIVDITMGQSPDGATYSDTPSDYILIQGNADIQNGWVVPRVWTTQITKKADAGDLIMSVRAPAGAMGKTAYDAVIGRGVAAIKGNEFIFQTLIKMDIDGYWKKYSEGSTFESLNSNSIKNAIISIPSQSEQDCIGCYLTTLDTLVSLQQRKLEKLQNVKKAMLEKMFV